MPERTRIDTTKYRRVKEQKEERAENELVVTKSDDRATLMRRGIKLLTEEDTKHRTITVKAQGNGAIANAIVVAEIIKRRVKDLHQETKIGTVTLVDRYEPIHEPKEGEDPLEEKTVERNVIQMVILLSLDELDKEAIGYQAPLPEDQVEVDGSVDAFDDKKKQKQARGIPIPSSVRGRGSGYLPRRGGRGNAVAIPDNGGRGGKAQKGGGKKGNQNNWNASSYRGGKGASYRGYYPQPDYYGDYYGYSQRGYNGYSGYGNSSGSRYNQRGYAPSQSYGAASGGGRYNRDAYSGGYGGYSTGGYGSRAPSGGRYAQDRYYSSPYYRY